MKAKRIVSLLIACTLFAASAPVATFAEEMPSVGEEVTFEEAFDESAPMEDAEPAMKADVEEADEMIAEAVEDSDMDASKEASAEAFEYVDAIPDEEDLPDEAALPGQNDALVEEGMEEAPVPAETDGIDTESQAADSESEGAVLEDIAVTEAEIRESAEDAASPDQGAELVLAGAGDDAQSVIVKTAMDTFKKTVEDWLKDYKQVDSFTYFTNRVSDIASGVSAGATVLKLLGVGPEDAMKQSLAAILTEIIHLRDTLESMDKKIGEIQSQLAELQASVEEKDRAARARNFLAAYQSFNNSYVEPLANLFNEYKGFINQSLKAWWEANEHAGVYLLYTDNDGQYKLTYALVADGENGKPKVSRNSESVDAFVYIPAECMEDLAGKSFSVDTYREDFVEAAAPRILSSWEKIFSSGSPFREDWESADDKAALAEMFAGELLSTIIYQQICQTMSNNDKWVISVKNAFLNLCSHVQEKNSGIDAIINVLYMTNAFEGEAKQQITDICRRMISTLGLYGIFAMSVVREDTLQSQAEAEDLTDKWANAIVFMDRKLKSSLTGHDNYCYLCGGVLEFTTVYVESQMDLYWKKYPTADLFPQPNVCRFSKFQAKPWKETSKMPPMLGDKWMLVLYHHYQQNKANGSFMQFLSANGLNVEKDFKCLLTTEYKGARNFNLADYLEMDVVFSPTADGYFKSLAGTGKTYVNKKITDDKYWTVHDKIEHNYLDPATGKLATNQILAARAALVEDHWYWKNDELALCTMNRTGGHKINYRYDTALSEFLTVKVPVFMLSISKLPALSASGEPDPEEDTLMEEELDEISPILAFDAASYMHLQADIEEEPEKTAADWTSMDILELYEANDRNIDEMILYDIERAISRAEDRGIKVALSDAEKKQLEQRMKAKIYELQEELLAFKPDFQLDVLGINQNASAKTELAKNILSVWDGETDKEISAEDLCTASNYEAGVVLDFVEKNGKTEAEISPAIEVKPLLLIWDSDTKSILYYTVSDEDMYLQDLRMHIRIPAASLKDQTSLDICQYDSFDDLDLSKRFRTALKKSGQNCYVEFDTKRSGVFTLQSAAGKDNTGSGKLAFYEAMINVPSAAAIKETDRAAVNAASAVYNAITDAGTRAEVAAAKAKLDAAQSALDYPTITFSTAAKSARKKLNKTWKNGSRTKRVVLGKGKKLKLNAKSSTGAKITYKSGSTQKATVSAKGIIKGKKKGNVTITLTCRKTTVKVLIKVK